MSESESEYEEEETLVMVDLHGVIDSEIFSQDSFNKFKILGVDTEQPILQVENFVFTGEYDQTIGTAVMFEEVDKKVKKSDPVFCKKPPTMLKYVCKTNKKLNMKRVFVSERAKEGEENANDGNEGTDDVQEGEDNLNEEEMDLSQKESAQSKDCAHSPNRSDKDVIAS
ncbi:unnamed protein product [Meganyctiphanes norvegica]|uniref:Transcription factor TFIIIC triple barrel domain-containing protein n=1 Tax=Meganyctiphanes norvegica TaxID=48144 RepID=A0AAV2S327_MEGNR